MDEGDKRELNYKGALEFIGEVRSGVSWERFCSFSMQYFAAFIDILSYDKKVNDFFSKNSIDKTYAVRNVRGIMHKLHCNRNKDYYLALGLSYSATEAQIVKRWRELMMIYHPDRNADDEYASECAKRINEAYNVLKDGRKRSEYLSKRIRHARLNHKISGGFNFQETMKGGFMTPKMRRILPKAVTVSFFMVPVLALLAVFALNRQSDDFFAFLKKEDAPVRQEAVKEERSAANASSEHISIQNNPAAVSKDADFSKRPEEDIKEKEAKSVKKAYKAKAIQKTTMQKETAPLKPAPQKKEPETSQIIAQASQEPQKKEQDAESQEQKRPVIPVIAQETQVSPKLDIKEAEAEAEAQKSNISVNLMLFIKKYIDAYQKGDINNFMTLYSGSAVENGLAYEDIKRSYQKYFKKRRYNSLDIKNVEFVEKGNNIIVRAVYVLRKIKNDTIISEKKGSINWILVKDDKTLLILKSEYDRS